MRNLTPSPPSISTGEYTRAILHIDGDAFFASCEQSRDPNLKGRPVITGSERGIASSLSYEAKARGVRRTMSMREIKKICPEAVIIPSDYETYSILSKRLYAIVRRYTPDVEEYGIDECFADITGLRCVYKCSYENIAKMIKGALDKELGFTFSVGLAPSKVVAKIGSKWEKPSGLTAIERPMIPYYLNDLDIADVWGIGPQTTKFLKKHATLTALDFACRDEVWIKKWTTKPHYEIWQELNGLCVRELITKRRESPQSISRVRTFMPPSRDRDFVFSQLAKNIESACMKARRYHQESLTITISLKTQSFRISELQISLPISSAFPHEIIDAITPSYLHLFQDSVDYRATGVCLSRLKKNDERKIDLFGEHLHAAKMQRLYHAVDKVRDKYGKNTLHLGASHKAHKKDQQNTKGDTSIRRRENLLPGETSKKRLGIPLFMGDLL